MAYVPIFHLLLLSLGFSTVHVRRSRQTIRENLRLNRLSRIDSSSDELASISYFSSFSMDDITIEEESMFPMECAVPFYSTLIDCNYDDYAHSETTMKRSLCYIPQMFFISHFIRCKIKENTSIHLILLLPHVIALHALFCRSVKITERKIGKRRGCQRCVTMHPPIVTMRSRPTIRRKTAPGDHQPGNAVGQWAHFLNL